jgi:hypothetical protein
MLALWCVVPAIELLVRPDFGATFASSQVDAGAAKTFSPYA